MTEASITDRVAETAHIWQDYRPTSLVELPRLAYLTDTGRIFVKVEGERPLGNFKALGGMVAGLRALARAAGVSRLQDLSSFDPHHEPLPRLICASDGNHGLAVAAAARRANTQACIYLPEGIGELRASRITALGGEIIRVTGTYDDAVHAASAAAAQGEGLLIPDTTSDPADITVKDVMTGYALLTRELVAQFRDEVRDRPSHMYIQAGVGGLAAAMAVGFREFMHEPKRLVVVEPESACCVARALAAGQPVRIPGNLHSSAEMLSCGLASAPALEILLRHAVDSIVVHEDQLRAAVKTLKDAGGPDTTPSGAAGLAGLLQTAARPASRANHGLDSESKVLLVITEGPLQGIISTA